MAELEAIFDVAKAASRFGVSDLSKVASTTAFRAAEPTMARVAEEASPGTARAVESAAGDAGGEVAQTADAAASSAGKKGFLSRMGARAKKLLGLSGSAATGYEAAKLGSELAAAGKQPSGDEAGTGPNDEIVANPGAVSPAGVVDVPDVGIAPELAESAQVPERIEGSSAPNQGKSSDSEIVHILKEILAQEKSSASGMARGFAEMARMQSSFIRSSVAERQASAIEATSSGGGGGTGSVGSLFSGAFGFAGSSMKSIAAGVGIAAVVGAGAELAKQAMNPSSGEKESQKNEPATANDTHGKAAQHTLESSYKKKYGDDWAQKLVDSIYERIKNDPGFSAAEKKNKDDAAYLLYNQVKDIYDKGNDQTKRAIETAIGKELGLTADEVRNKAIDKGNGWEGSIGAFTDGVTAAAVVGGIHTVSFLGKAATSVGNGIEHGYASFIRGMGFGDKADKIDKSADAGMDSRINAINDFDKTASAKAGHALLSETDQAIMANHKIATKAGQVLGSTASFSMGSSGIKSPASEASAINKQEGNAEDNKPMSEKEKDAIAFFVSKGWSQAQAEGIVANLIAESGLKVDATGDNGEAYGIGQWHPDRQKKFEQVMGKSIKDSTFQDQLAFVNWELNNTHKSAGDALKQTKTARSAADVVVQQYEISAQRFGSDAVKRGNIAESLAGQYGGSSPEVAAVSGHASSMHATSANASPNAEEVPIAQTAPQVASAQGSGNVNANVTNDNRNMAVSHTSVNADSAAMPANLAPHVT